MITTVVGNYPRIGPGLKAPSVRTAISKLDREEISPDEFQQVQDEVTAEAIQEQVEAGLDLVTDGQIRWDDGQTYFARKLDGFEITGLARYFDTNTYYRQPVATGKIAWREPIAVGDYEFACANSARPVKPVITGPYTIARLSQPGTYGSFEDLVMDLAEALNHEAAALERAGATIIQFDEPAIIQNTHDLPLFQRAMERLTLGVKTKTALYTYFGDVAGIARDFLSLPFQVFGLDFVMGPRNYEAVRELPSDRELGLGAIDARNTRLESIEEINAAVERVAPWVPLERIYLNPSAGLEFLPRENARAKVRRMTEAVAAVA